MISPKNSPTIPSSSSPKLSLTKIDITGDLPSEPDYEACGILQKQELCIRLLTMINHSTLELFCKIFHDSKDFGYPTEPAELYLRLKKMEAEFLQMKNEGGLTEEEFNLLFSASKETYSQEFSVNLFHTVCRVCLLILDQNYNIDNESKTSCKNALDLLDKIKDVYISENLKNLDEEEFSSVWENICQILKSLNYDISKIQELQSGSMDNRKFRFARVKSELYVLNTALLGLFKTTKINTFTIEKLILNLREAKNQYAEEFNSTEELISEQSLVQLKDEIEFTSKMLLKIKNDIAAVFPDMKFWREKNIEGDIIIIDETLCRLKNQINEQSFNVRNVFSTISLDIVKMKEKVNKQEENEQYVIPTLERVKSNSFKGITKHRSSAVVK